jgi:hypothetical protein
MSTALLAKNTTAVWPVPQPWSTEMPPLAYTIECTAMVAGALILGALATFAGLLFSGVCQ